MLNALNAPIFIERVCLGDNKQIMQAARAIRRAVECQVKGLGFAFVEVLSPCPTIWKLDPLAAQKFVREEMAAVFPLGNLRDLTKEAPVRPAPAPAPPIESLPAIMELTEEEDGAAANTSKPLDLRIKVAGFGGQGVLMLGDVLAEAGLDAGYQVSWLPSYGPEMRSGTSNCHVRIGSEPVDSPLVSRPNILIAMNEPSLHKFIAAVEPGGIVLYNEEQLPEGCSRPDVRFVTANFTSIADHLGSAKAANMVMLGALLEATGILEEAFVAGAIKRRVKTQRWFDLDMAAVAVGRKQVHAALPA